MKLHVGTDSHLIRETMNAVEAKLSSDMFVRIHRCHIVNIEQVRELQPWFNGEYVVFLKNGTRLTLSRGYRERLQERVGRGFEAIDLMHDQLLRRFTIFRTIDRGEKRTRATPSRFGESRDDEDLPLRPPLVADSRDVGGRHRLRGGTGSSSSSSPSRQTRSTVGPGQRQLTRRPEPATSSASASVKDRT